MAKINVTIPHTQPRLEALTRIKGLLAEVGKQYGDQVSDLEENWDHNVGTFSFNILGMSVSGTLTVGDSDVVLDGTIPLAAVLWKKKIIATVTERANKLLA